MPGELCPDLADLLDGFGGFAANSEDAPQGEAAAGEAETPNADETIKELQDLLGVKP